ncbi:histone acetylase complex subunit MRG15-2 [Metarhizium album ARSEF 1941]|uniref:Chromatin modification-related protein EAF3 n=1 Tax=Metarhizium album (strain ARSEF 1941) TaxID=1081103 RepID=A0A0B2X8J5_METAS|nr:histone acetylase complex subunit MRG15-2 [Metarhizium album ARSEF 1941]KHO01845.1 histone acetylase complex subunit MRG15-2 [Metarhizium album ARSEF 1941]
MAPARQQQTPQFNKDEKVLCFHMDMLYEAKVMDVQPGEKPGDGFRYKVHYKGWKNTWDDWVLADRIRPFDDEHKELAAQLHANLKSSMQKPPKQPKKNLKGGDSARGSEERGSGAPQGGRGARRGKDWELEQVREVIISHKLVVVSRAGLEPACLPAVLCLGGAPQVLAMSTASTAEQTCRAASASLRSILGGPLGMRVSPLPQGLPLLPSLSLFGRLLVATSLGWTALGVPPNVCLLRPKSAPSPSRQSTVAAGFAAGLNSLASRAPKRIAV